MSYIPGNKIAAGPVLLSTRVSSDVADRLELFEKLMLPHLNAAHNLARWITRSDQDAQDVVQEAYLRAFRFFDAFKGGDGKAWLLEIVRNTCRTFHSRRREEPMPFDDAVDVQSDTSVEVEERLDDERKADVLRRCIEALPVEFREVLIMREFEEMSYKQIADATELATGTVMSRLYRARKRLQECAKRRRKEAAR